MLNEYDKETENFLRWYIEVKSVLTSVESVDLNGLVYIQPYNELRYALDHFMRAMAWADEQATVADSRKAGLDSTVKNALGHAVGHLQRAYSDIVEWYFLTVKQTCFDILDPYTVEQIKCAVPDYYSEFKPFLVKFTEDLILYKENKSSEKNDLTAGSSDEPMLFNSDNIKKLTQIYKTVQKAEPSLVEMKLKETEKKNKEAEMKDKEVRKNTIKSIIITVLTGLFCAVVGGVIVWLITQGGQS